MKTPSPPFSFPSSVLGRGKKPAVEVYLILLFESPEARFGRRNPRPLISAPPVSVETDISFCLSHRFRCRVDALFSKKWKTARRPSPRPGRLLLLFVVLARDVGDAGRRECSPCTPWGIRGPIR